MSRALARLRETTGDPLLVQGGPRPRSDASGPRTPRTSQSARAGRRSGATPCRKTRSQAAGTHLHAADQRRLSWRTSDRASSLAPARKRPACGCASCRKWTRTARRFVTVPSTWKPALSMRRLVRKCAPGRCSGTVTSAPCACGHPLSRGKITPARYASGKHILVSRQGLDKGPLDEAFERAGLEREIVTIVGGFSAALTIARATDLIATVPERHTANLRGGMCSFPLPVPTQEFTISMLWHPRLHADPAHQWLRSLILDTCAAIR